MQSTQDHFLLPLAGQPGQQPIHRCTFVPDSLLAEDQAQLPAQLLQQASSRRQAEFLAGRFAAKAALQAAGYTGTETPGIGPQRQPLWPEGYCGSITHHRQQALAVAALISDEIAGIGLDLEGLMADSVAREIADELLANPAEQHLVASGLLLPYTTLMTLIFSAKESLFKALFPLLPKSASGQGDIKGFDTASLVAVSLQPAEFTLVLNEDWGPQLPAGKAFRGSWQLQQDQLLTLIRV